MQKSDYRNMWVYIEHDGVTAAPVGLELCCELRKLCDTTGDRLYAVILGELPETEVEKVKECGIDGLIFVSGTGYEYFNTDAYANAFTVLSRKYHPSAIFVGGTINGRDFAPRFAVQLETGCTSDAMQLEYDPATGDIQFIEPAVGGKIMAVITVPVLRPQVGTIRPGTFKYAPTGKKAEIEEIREEISFDPEAIRCRHIDFIPDEADPEMDIANADCIVCVGNGLKDSEHLERYRTLDDCGEPLPATQDNPAGEKVWGSDGKLYTVGSRIVSQALLRRVQVCRPTHIVLNLGINDGDSACSAEVSARCLEQMMDAFGSIPVAWFVNRWPGVCRKDLWEDGYVPRQYEINGNSARVMAIFTALAALLRDRPDRYILDVWHTQFPASQHEERLLPDGLLDCSVNDVHLGWEGQLTAARQVQGWLYRLLSL